MSDWFGLIVFLMTISYAVVLVNGVEREYRDMQERKRK